MKSKQNW